MFLLQVTEKTLETPLATDPDDVLLGEESVVVVGERVNRPVGQVSISVEIGTQGRVIVRVLFGAEEDLSTVVQVATGRVHTGQ